MSANKEPVCLRGLAAVKKYGDPNINLPQALDLASELRHVIDCISIQWNPGTTVTLLDFSEEALRHGLRSPGTAQEKIQAVVDYQRSNPSLPMRKGRHNLPISTSPRRIANQLQAALEGNTDFISAAETRDDCDLSGLSPDMVLLAAQIFMYRNGHGGASDEEALQAFHAALRYQDGELQTSAEFIECRERELTEIIKCVNLHFIEESIDIVGLKLVQDVKANIKPDTGLPKSKERDVYGWEVLPISSVGKYVNGEELFQNRGDDYIIPQWGYEQGRKSYRSYIFCSTDEYSRRGYYVMQFRKTVTVNGSFTDIRNIIDWNNRDPAGVLKAFQAGKENLQVDSVFQKRGEYLWGRDGKPPALPYFLVAQLYWPHFVGKVKYLQEQDKRRVADREALAVVYAEVPALAKEKKEDTEKPDPTLRTYTWFLNKPDNAVNDFPELRDYSEGQPFSDDYLHPSAEPLQTEGFEYEWSREIHERTPHNFTLIYRARPTCERVPQTVWAESRMRFDYWQYIKEFVFFGGSSTEGTVVAPDPAWIDEAHRNGVAIFGTVFLPPLRLGGNELDIEELAQPENLEKLVEIAQRLNFEGWFLNVESYKSYDSASLKTLKASIEKTNLRGKTFIWYLPLFEQSVKLKPGNTRSTCDGNISNLSSAFQDEGGEKLHLDFSKLKDVQVWREPPLKYLMFVDEPFWKIKLGRGKGYLVDLAKYAYAQNCHWQFFLGENGLYREPTDPNPWYGIAKYAQKRKHKQ